MISRVAIGSRVFNSMTIKLCDCVIPTNNEISSSQQGGITHTKLVLDEIFFISPNVIDALNNFLKIFESKGLTWIQGKNVSVITKQLHAAMISLDEVGALPDETYGDILCGFTECSNEDFKTVFQHLLTQERIDHFSSHTTITTFFHGCLLLLHPLLPKSSEFFGMPMISTTTLQPRLNGLSIIELVHASGRDHGLNHCKEPCGQTCIVQNRAQFQEERNCQSSYS